LALYLAPEWKHYRSTRKIISPPPASPDPANTDLETADDVPMSRVSSGSANAEPQLNLPALVPVKDGPVSQSSQDVEGNGFIDQQQDPRHEELKTLDANLLQLPYGPKDPYQIYLVLNVEIKALYPRSRLHNTKSFRSCFIPTNMTPTKTPGLLNFRSLGPSKGRSPTRRSDKNMTGSLGGPILMSSESRDVPQSLHCVQCRDARGNANQSLNLRQRGCIAERPIPLTRKTPTRLNPTELAITRRQMQ